MKPSLVLLAGPNGAGKSTLYETRAAPSFAGLFINADIIQRDELKNPSPRASYEAAMIAEARRTEMLNKGQSFATETVFSHPSKLEIINVARTQGYHIIVMHVGVDSPNLSVARVRACTQKGWHDVPEEKIRSRYDRSQPLIREAVLLADRGMVLDNSKLNSPPELMLVFAASRLVQATPTLPQWILPTYAADLIH